MPSNKFPYPSFIHVNGFEFHLYENKLSFPKDIPTQDRKNARAFLKGLKTLWKRAAQKDFFESAGEKIHGNTNDQNSKYQKLQRACSQNDIINIGNGSPFAITSYVDGSYTISFSL